MTDGRADLCFLAVDPEREKEVAFTAPYVVIQGVYAVPARLSLATTSRRPRGRRWGSRTARPTTSS